MLNRIKDLLFQNSAFNGEKAESKETTRDLKKRANVAVCALLIEMASFDGDFDDDEKEVINNLIKEKFGLSDEEADELISISNEQRDKSIDLWQFTKHINLNYSKKERINLLEMLWQVVYADGHLHGNEDFLVHKLATLLKLEHKDLIGAKIRVKEAL